MSAQHKRDERSGCVQQASRTGRDRWKRVTMVLAVLAVWNSTSAAAATLTVTTLGNSGVGSLRDTIAASSAGDTIDFDPGLAGTITLTTGALVINKTLTITGPGADVLTINGNNADRVFVILGTIATPIAVSISGLTVTGAQKAGQNGGGIYSDYSTTTLTAMRIAGNTSQRGAAAFSFHGAMILTGSVVTSNNATETGGGLYNSGFSVMTLIESTVTDNHTGNGTGGGLRNDGGGLLEVVRSTISGNTSAGSSFGGGAIFSRGAVTMTNSTVFDNGAGGYGGALAIYDSVASLVLTDSTVAGNTAGTLGGGIFNNSTPVNATNSIVADNHVGGTSSNCWGAGGVSGGHNLSSDSSCSFLAAAGDIQNANAGLDPAGLQDNGGPTATVALVPGSDAIDAGGGSCSATDQRGIVRPQGAGCDIGAFELKVETPQESIQHIVDIVVTLNLKGGLTNALDAKLSSAMQALEDLNTHNDVAAVNSLYAFINMVEAQRDKGISTEAADTLIAGALHVIELLTG